MIAGTYDAIYWFMPLGIIVIIPKVEGMRWRDRKQIDEIEDWCRSAVGREGLMWQGRHYYSGLIQMKFMRKQDATAFVLRFGG